MAPKTAVQVPILPFEESVGRVMEELVAAARELVGAVPFNIRRAVDLERSLQLERKLAWQVFRLSRSEGAAEVANVPSVASAVRVAEAARASGVPETVTQQFVKAFDRFENFALAQCGDRARLVSMVNGLTHERSENLETKIRKSLFRGNAHLWGVQAEKQVRTLIYDPNGPAGETLRSYLISGNLGMHGLRRGEPVTISSWFSPTPLEGAEGTAAPAPGFELLGPFSSANLPEMVHVPGKSGMYETEMVIPPSGRTEALTLYLTQTAPSAGDVRKVGAGAGMFVSVPSEEYVAEILVPAGYTSPATARVAIFGRRHHPERVFEERDIDLLSQTESAKYIGTHTNVPAMEGVPRHHEVVQHVLAARGLAGRRFDIYRCRVEFPAMHTLIVMRVDGAGSR